VVGPGDVRSEAPVLRVQAGHAGWLMPDETSRIDTPGPLPASVGRQRGGVAVHPEGNQPTPVDGRDPVGQPQLIAGHPAVADPSVAASDQPGDRAFHHRPPPPVAGLEPRMSGLAAGGLELGFPGVDQHRAATGSSRAARSQRAGAATAPNLASPEGLITTCCPAGQVTERAARSMVKSSLVNPPWMLAWEPMGLMVWWWPAARSMIRTCPLP
jgi:hypothetical protein